MWDTTMNEKGEETIMAFVHLHTHTEYSLLDGSNKIKEYVSRVKELGMNSAAITDHGNMYGVVEFYKTAKAADINPVIGCEIYVAPNSRFDRETSHGEDRYYHLILLAENNTGYANLMKIVSIGFTKECCCAAADAGDFRTAGRTDQTCQITAASVCRISRGKSWCEPSHSVEC
jgi:DNA polymerase III alpha subunit